MSPDESKTDTAYETALNEHYGVTDLGDDILDALEAAGKDVDALSREDIASFDEFHIRGLEATREVADLAEIKAHSRVLDVGCGIGGPGPHPRFRVRLRCRWNRYCRRVLPGSDALY